MKAKIKNDLAYLYELPEFKSFKNFCDEKRDKIAKQILAIDMSAPDAVIRIAMWQGQYEALQFIQLELQSIHKKEMEKR